MLWRRKQADSTPASQNDVLAPAELRIKLDPGVFASKFECMLEAVEDQGGLPVFIESLTKKHELFARALDETSLVTLGRDGRDALLETVFTARRKLPDVFAKLELSEINAAIRELIYGTAPLSERMSAFVAIVPVVPSDDRAVKKANLKLHRAAWDFAAELLHYRKPEQYPLLSRWVWDANTVSGAMREFIAGNDTLRESPFDNRPETFEAVRQWMAEQLSTSGVYRDIPFLIDMVLGWAYADYMRAMSSSMGLIEAEFGGKQDATEPMRKILGIDLARRSGQSRVKRETVQ